MPTINMQYETVEDLKAVLGQEAMVLSAVSLAGKAMINNFEENIFVGSLGSNYCLWATNIFVTMGGLGQRTQNAVKLLGEALEEMQAADQNLKNSIPR